MRYRTPRIALVVALGATAAGCGSDEMFEPQLASNERLVERAAAARLDLDDQTILHATVVGDIDGDGIDDAIVMSSFDVRDIPQDRLYVLYGGSAVTGKINVASLPSLTEPPSTEAGSQLGGIVGVGDVDGDGLADFLIGFEPSLDNQEIHHRGGAYLVYGSRTRFTGPTPLASVAVWLRDTDPLAEANHTARLGDLDGDGYADFAITRSTHILSNDLPVVYLFYGRGQRPNGTVDLAAAADAVITTGADFVLPVVGVGDVDGDGHSDFLVTTASIEKSGQDIRLVRGTATRLSGTVAVADIAQTRFPSDDPTWKVPRPAAAALGDLDHDGFDDFTIADNAEDRDTPWIRVVHRVFYGRPGGFPAQVAAGDEDAAIHLLGGRSEIASADVDGDGVLDVIVSDVGASHVNGAVHVIYGTGQRLSGTIEPATRALTYVGMAQHGIRCRETYIPDCIIPEELGDELSVGDLTGDHRADLLIYAPIEHWIVGQLGVHGSALARAYVVSPPAQSNP
jgi:hypothetical protein